MIKASLSTIMMIVLANTLAAQHGRALPGPLYPEGYAGDIFTGSITSTDDASDSLTMAPAGGKKEFFTGRLEKPCSIPTANGKAMRPSDMPVGTALIVYYDRKKNYRNEDDNVIFAVTITNYEGKPVPDIKRRLYPCTNRPMRYAPRGGE